MSEHENNENTEQKDTVKKPIEQKAEQTDSKSPKPEKRKEEKDDKHKWYIRITIILIIIIIILFLLLLRQCSSDVPVLNPDFPPQETEENMQPPPVDDDDKLDHEEGGGAVSLSLSDKLAIDLSDKQATLNFANPGRSTQNIVLWITIQGVTIAQSGLITPGNKVTKLDLIEDAATKLAEGIYNGKFVLYYYDPENNERATVNTEIPVTVTVNQ